MSKLSNRPKPASSLNTLDETEEIDFENDRKTPARDEALHVSRIIDLSNNNLKSVADSNTNGLTMPKISMMRRNSKQSITSMKKHLELTNLTNRSQEYESGGETSRGAKSGGVKFSPHLVSKTPVDYEKLVRNKCGDLTKLTYANGLEKYLITRIYSNVNKLSSLLVDMDEANLTYFMKTPDENECLPLYYAIKSDCLNSVKLLLNKGSGLVKTTSAGDPAVHLACLLGVSVELIDYLLSFEPQANLYRTDQEGWTILHCASNQGHLDIVKYLIEKKCMNPNVKDSKYRFTSLQLATVNNRLNVVDYFLSFMSMGGIRTPSTMSRRVPSDNVQVVIQRQTSANEPSKDTSTPLLSISGEERQSEQQQQQQQLQQFVSGRDAWKNFFSSQVTQASSIVVKRPKSQLSSSSLDDQETPQIRFFREEKRTHAEPMYVFNNYAIDLNSQTNEGQTCLHLACRYGRFQVVDTLLKKYGSHCLNLNTVDFRGHTCLDLAWTWIINLNSFDNVNKNHTSYFYDHENSYYVQRNSLIVDDKLENQIKLLHLLCQYGAKFSTFKHLLYDVESLNETTDIYDVHSCVSALTNKNNHLIPIRTYLRALMFIFKLNFPTMILHLPNERSITPNLSNRQNSSDLKSLTSRSNSSTASSSHSASNSSSVQIIKAEFSANLDMLKSFIANNVIDSFEKQFYFKMIETLLESLANFT